MIECPGGDLPMIPAAPALPVRMRRTIQSRLMREPCPPSTAARFNQTQIKMEIVKASGFRPEAPLSLSL